MALTCNAVGCKDEFTRGYYMNLNFKTEWGVNIRREREYVSLCARHAPPEDVVMQVEQQASA